MVSCAAAASSCIQLDPAVLTKKLTIVAALAVSATAVYLLFGGTRNRSKNEEEAAEDRRDCAFSPDSSSSSAALSPEEDFTAAAAKEQFRDNIAMATEKPETVLHASSDHHQVLLEIVHEANTGPPRSSGQASLSPSSPSSSSATRRLLLSSSPERACSGQACSGSPSRRLPSSERMCCSPATAAAAARLSPSRNPSLNTTTTRSVGVCTDPVGAGGDQLELLRVVKREDIPPPSYDYLEMVSSTLEEDPAATSTCESHINSQGAAACEICIHNHCEKCSLGGCDICLPTAACSLSSIVSQNKEPDLGQKYLGKTLNSSRSQQKKKVRWTPNTVEPSGDNQDYRRRPRSTIHSVCHHSPIQRPLTSYACERPRLQSQAAKNTITGTQQTVLKSQYNYL
ncbi:hypothetical protein BDL97_10G028600 [Sphagnum fallax]|nr:hypothetical protein BDL97_10G028600 [Sphagnum fallax]